MISDKYTYQTSESQISVNTRQLCEVRKQIHKQAAVRGTETDTQTGSCARYGNRYTNRQLCEVRKQIHKQAAVRGTETDTQTGSCARYGNRYTNSRDRTVPASPPLILLNSLFVTTGANRKRELW